MRARRRSIPFLVAALTFLGLFTPMIVVLDRDTDVDAAVRHAATPPT